MRKIGKIGKRNQEANRINYQRFLELGINSCELCGSALFLAVAHREKREWYRSCPELLSDEAHTILICQKCHDKLDDRSKTTKEESDRIFESLRI